MYSNNTATTINNFSAPTSSSPATTTTTVTTTTTTVTSLSNILPASFSSVATPLSIQIPGYRSLTQQMASSFGVVPLQASYIPQLVPGDITLPDGYVLKPAFPFTPPAQDNAPQQPEKIVLYQDNTQPPVVIRGPLH
eukprot:c4104_g1_i1.p1 GENE.c4104_g1_i1~~c4104_g1_i1.p1  ORF type:complete len:144 (-),score=47.82 c4104_g1_i1:96-506(-)